MGCTNSKRECWNLYQCYMNTGMPQPWSNEIENNFEKELFMAINLLRNLPAIWVDQIKDCRRVFPEFKKDSKLITEVSEFLKKQTPLNMIKIDKEANEACRKNNRAVVEKNEDEVAVGGNLDLLKEMKEQAPDAVEMTFSNWDHGACLLVAHTLLTHFKANPPSKESPAHAFLDPSVTLMGLSNRGHQKVSNVIQILLIRVRANQLE